MRLLPNGIHEIMHSAFLDLHLSISNDTVSTKIYNKRDDFDFELANFPVLVGDVPRSTSYGVYISQSQKEQKDKETIQSSTTPDPGYHMGK